MKHFAVRGAYDFHSTLEDSLDVISAERKSMTLART
jgi:hypothetical protein